MRYFSTFLIASTIAVSSAEPANWQYQVPFETAKPAKDGKPGQAFLWLPPESKTLRGLLIGGQLKIDLDLALDHGVRRACTENDIGLVYFVPHVSALFPYWTEGNTDTKRGLKSLDDLADRSGHPELRRVPWITMGHSTAGIFSRNVAYWQPERVAGVLHIKSGNFHQKDHLPAGATLTGVPLLAINGQFETFGPEGGIRPEFGRETQWMFVRKDIETFRKQDANHLMSLWLDLGADHFHGSRETADLAALFIRRTAKHRLPSELPNGDGPIRCFPLKAEDGWLSDTDLYQPKHKPAPFKGYTGDRSGSFCIRCILWRLAVAAAC